MKVENKLIYKMPPICNICKGGLAFLIISVYYGDFNAFLMPDSSLPFMLYSFIMLGGVVCMWLPLLVKRLYAVISLICCVVLCYDLYTIELHAKQSLPTFTTAQQALLQETYCPFTKPCVTLQYGFIPSPKDHGYYHFFIEDNQQLGNTKYLLAPAERLYTPQELADSQNYQKAQRTTFFVQSVATLPDAPCLTCHDLFQRSLSLGKIMLQKQELLLQADVITNRSYVYSKVPQAIFTNQQQNIADYLLFDRRKQQYLTITTDNYGVSAYVYQATDNGSLQDNDPVSTFRFLDDNTIRDLTWQQTVLWILDCVFLYQILLLAGTAGESSLRFIYRWILMYMHHSMYSKEELKIITKNHD